MKTTNVYGIENLSGDHNVICPYCGKRIRPKVFSHNDLIGDKPELYKRMISFMGEQGVFMICPECSEMFFAYASVCMDKSPTLIYNNPVICGNANMFIRTNLKTADMMTEVENIFAHKKMDITVYRPYEFKAGYIGEQTVVQLYNSNEQLICSIYNIDTDKFIRDNVKALKLN